MSEQMTLSNFGVKLDNKEWEYDEDNSNMLMLCRCPDCGGRMIIHLWHYWNNYKYCPYCGIRLQEGNFVKRYCQIYKGEDEQTVLRLRREHRRR